MSGNFKFPIRDIMGNEALSCLFSPTLQSGSDILVKY